MKIKGILLIIVLVMAAKFSQSTSPNIKAYLSYATFFSPVDGPYLETYLSVFAQSVAFVKNNNDKFQGKAEVTMIFRQDTSIIAFKKYNLSSQEIEDSTKTDFYFLDVKRYALKNGKYVLDFKIKDLNSSKPQIEVTDTVLIDFPDNKINLSSIEMIEKYQPTSESNILSKGGYDFVPYPLSFYYKSMKQMPFYIEIYNTEKVLGVNEKYMIKTYINAYETDQLAGDFVKQKMFITSQAEGFFHDFNIEDLPSGNYFLVIDVIDKNLQTIASDKVFFQRSNPDLDKKPLDLAKTKIENTFVQQYSDSEQLADYIRSLDPIATPQEQYNMIELLKSEDSLDLMKKFFYYFWLSRDKLNPEAKWNDYKGKVDFVNEEYGAMAFKGYETDRGIIYLKYGPPNTIKESPFGPATRPYEIWHYYNIQQKYRNVKFVFYNPDLVTDNYQLIHSTMRGEVNNPHWQYLLHNNTIPGDVDAGEVDDSNSWGEDTYQNFKNPK